MDESTALPPISQQSCPRLAAKARVQPDRLTGQPALLYPEGVLMLNPTGAAIVEQCDGKHSVQEIVATLAERYGAPPDQISPDVLEYLERLRAKRLIDLNSEAGK
jgi:pyrroloquinoline quinone biosynthesis protein D